MCMKVAQTRNKKLKIDITRTVCQQIVSHFALLDDTETVKLTTEHYTDLAQMYYSGSSSPSEGK